MLGRLTLTSSPNERVQLCSKIIDDSTREVDEKDERVLQALYFTLYARREAKVRTGDSR
jgi:hypothetical protein